jgi:DNA-binding transcriptional MerR regulator/methylmalonyl-CoA mutase cobalamin-binding subunit
VSEPGDRWRIKEFAALVGVQEETLRAWERRYRLLQPQRSAGGYRLYSPADARRIRAMQAHMERGLAAAQAAALAVGESGRDIVAPAEPGALLEALIDAAMQFDATRLDALLDAAFARGAIAGIRDVILPVLADIGVRWERGELTVGHEHFASHLIERRLLGMAKGWESGSGPLALLACAPGERHTLGLVCFGLALADRGWRIAYLGADTPVDQVAEMSDALRPAAVVLCAIAAQRLTAVGDAIGELGRAHHTIIAGSAASAELAERLGVHRADGDVLLTAQALAERPPAGGSPAALR